MVGTRGMCSASTRERLTDQKIGQKNMIIICTAFTRKELGNMNTDHFSRYCSSAGVAQVKWIWSGVFNRQVWRLT